MNCKDTCYFFKVIDETVVKRELILIHSTHGEADSRMIFHLATIQPPANVVSKTIDTDVLIIALGCFSLDRKGEYTQNTLRHKRQPNIQEIRSKTLRGPARIPFWQRQHNIV